MSPHITAELDEAGEIIGIEITNATAYVRDNILESAQVGRIVEREAELPTRPRLLRGESDS